MPATILEVRNPSGLHARPAATFVRAAAGFQADVRITNLSRQPEKSGSAKSILAVMGLGISRGHRIRIEAEGSDADEAVAALEALVASGAGEVIEP